MFIFRKNVAWLFSEGDFPEAYGVRVLLSLIDDQQRELDRLGLLESEVKGVLAQKGDDHCWRDIYTNMARLVGVEFNPEILTKQQMMKNCDHFVTCLLVGKHYIAPSVEWQERLEKVILDYHNAVSEYPPNVGTICSASEEIHKIAKEIKTRT